MRQSHNDVAIGPYGKGAELEGVNLQFGRPSENQFLPTSMQISDNADKLMFIVTAEIYVSPTFL